MLKLQQTLPALLLAAALLALPVTGTAGAQAQNAYESCTALIGKDPARALDQALEWKRNGGGAGALHCEALALLALGRDREAAGRFSETAAQMDGAPEEDRARVYAQAGDAWLLAGDPAAARAAYDEAVTRQPHEPDYLIGRARVRALGGDWAGVRADAGEALAEIPTSAEALTLRAGALRNLGHMKAALDDAERAVSLAPHNREALLERGLIRAASGNVAGARADWQDVIRYAKETGRADDAAAQAARDYLAKSGEAPAK
jgi:tetratricopeptide (TPR) repeat protein